MWSRSTSKTPTLTGFKELAAALFITVYCSWCSLVLKYTLLCRICNVFDEHNNLNKRDPYDTKCPFIVLDVVL